MQLTMQTEGYYGAVAPLTPIICNYARFLRFGVSKKALGFYNTRAAGAAAGLGAHQPARRKPDLGL